MNETLNVVESVKNRVMTLITKEERKKLLKAGYNGEIPIVKLFTGPLTWLVTGEEDGVLYGWADLGMDCIEWGGLCRVDELPTLKVGMFHIERDRWFTHKEGRDYSKLGTLAGI